MTQKKGKNILRYYIHDIQKRTKLWEIAGGQSCHHQDIVHLSGFTCAFHHAGSARSSVAFAFTSYKVQFFFQSNSVRCRLSTHSLQSSSTSNLKVRHLAKTA